MVWFRLEDLYGVSACMESLFFLLSSSSHRKDIANAGARKPRWKPRREKTIFVSPRFPRVGIRDVSVSAARRTQEEK